MTSHFQFLSQLGLQGQRRPGSRRPGSRRGRRGGFPRPPKGAESIYV